MPIAQTKSSDAEVRKGFANIIFKTIPLLNYYCKSRNSDTRDIIPFRADNIFVYNLITNANQYDKPTTDTRTMLLAMRDHALGLNLRCIAMPKIACGLDGMGWNYISSLLKQTFKNSGKTI